MPQAELRALFDRLQLDIVYHPAESALDVSLTLYGEDGPAFSGEKASEVWSVPPGGARLDLRKVVRLKGRVAVP
jgi:hypothetical protein